MLRAVRGGKRRNPSRRQRIRAGHFGLLGVRERVRQLRGSLGIDSEPGGGTRVRVEVPIGGLP
jgi:signal transduction histidine kinase